MTSIDSRLFVLRGRPSRQQIQVYDTKSFKQQQIIQVDGLSDDILNSGMTSCVTNNCLYVSDWCQHTVYKVELSANNKVSKWSVGRYPRGLAINTARNLIVASFWTRKIQEYNTAIGSLVREISLKSIDAELLPFHAIQLTSDQFVVSCVNLTNSAHDVVEIDTKGRVVVSYRNQLKPTTQHEFNWPRHLSVDENNEFIFVADIVNDRIVILDRSLKSCARELNMNSVDGGLEKPSCLYFNSSQNRLFVGGWCGRDYNLWSWFFSPRNMCRVLMFDNVI
jgi:hypothetical protein